MKQYIFLETVRFDIVEQFLTQDQTIDHVYMTTEDRKWLRIALYQ